MSNFLKKRKYQIPRLPRPRYMLAHQLEADLQSFVQQSTHLICEVGCGVGLHPLKLSLTNPYHQIIAIERTKEKFEKFKRRHVNHGSPKNLFPIHADAESVFNHYLPDESLDALYLMYPNPEYKNPARRWIRMPFFEMMLQKIKPLGVIFFVTNVSQYFEELKAVNQEFWDLKIIKEVQISRVEMPEFIPRTHFEKKYFLAGEILHEIHFQKQERS